MCDQCVPYHATASSHCVIITNSVHGGMNLAACRRGSAEEHKPAPHAGPLLSVPTSETRLLDKGKSDGAHPH